MTRRLVPTVCLVLCLCSASLGQLMIPANATDQSIVISIINPATLAAYTGLTVTNFDIYYHVAGAAIAAKVDATSGSVTAHSDNTAAEIGMGLYEIDLPDAIWASRANGTAIQIVIEWDTTNHYTVTKEIQICSPQTGDAFARLGAPAGASVSADVAAIKADTSSLGSAVSYKSAIAAGTHTASTFTLSTGPTGTSYFTGRYWWVTVVDATDGVPGGGIISNYDGATKTVTIEVGLPFTPAEGDEVYIMPMAAQPKWSR